MKLIIRSPNWVGDAVMALPTIDVARELTGADRVAVAARSSVARLYAGHPRVDQVIDLEGRDSGWKGIRRSAASVRPEKFDIGLLLPRSFSSALIFRLAGVHGRIGYKGDGRSFLLTRAVACPSEKKHRIDQYLFLLETIAGSKAASVRPQLHLTLEDIQSGGACLSRHKLTYDDPYLVIAPQAVAESRRWGFDNYGALAVRLGQQYDCRIVLVGMEADREAAGQVCRHLPDRIVNLCGETSLMEAAAILSFARLFVGNDSGLAHLAGAVNCPVVVLSGADDPEETSPRCAEKRLIIKNIPCFSCVKNVCPMKGDAHMLCMKLISVDEVADAATQIIKT